jgi:hypothetical protein
MKPAWIGAALQEHARDVERRRFGGASSSRE